MVRSLGALLAGLLLASAGAVRAADEAPAPAGSWKLTLPLQRGATWLVQLEAKDGKWTGTAAAAEKVPEAKVQNVTVADGALKFDLFLEQPGLTLPFEAAVPKEGDKIRGSVVLNGRAFPAEMDKTALTSFDAYDLLKDDLAKQAGTAQGVATALELIGGAEEKKASADEVRSWADKAAKWSEPYGERWHRETTVGVAETLADEKPFAAIALQYARQAERSLDPKKDSAGVQRRVLRALAAALNASDKKDEAKEVEERLEKIPVVTVKPFTRKGGDNVALVEMFTGSACPPCVTADTAFDALTKTYDPGEVVFLEYHLNIPAGDPMTTPDNEERAVTYMGERQSTPQLFVNGKKGPPAGGRGEDEAQDKYDDYTQVIQPLLEKPAKAHLKLASKLADGKSYAKADWSDLAETGDNVKLRFVLTEPEIAYTGANKVPFHHDVVRAFVGDDGVKGTALKDKAGKQVVTIDLDDVKKKVQEATNNVVNGVGISGKAPPVELKDLRLVAFIQNDDTGEILQAAQVDLATK